MASTILKSLQLTRILNRLSFTSTKLYYLNSSRVIRSLEYTRTNKACYATAAYKQLSTDESVINDNITSSNSQSTNPVDDALSKIDSLVRRTGRIQMKVVANAFSMITCKESTTSTHGLYLLRSCKFCVDEPPSKRVELMNQIWNKYQELGIQFDVKHYNTLLDIHISNGVPFNPVEILNSMEENGLEPNRNTYMLVMKKYCEDGNINGASEILEHMKEKGIPANEDVFNNLIQGHLKNKDISGANDILEVMKSSNLNPTADTYGTLACGYAESGNKDKMMSYLQMAGDESSIQYHLKVIDALASSGNQQYINDVLYLIQDKGIYQQELLNSAVELIHKGFDDVAFKMITTCMPHYEHSYFIFIKQLIKTEKPISEVIEYCSKIRGPFGDMIFQTALKTAVECGKFECTIPILKKMESLGFSTRPSSFWSLFAVFKDEKSQDGIWTILKQMVELGVPADFTTYYDHIYPVLEDLNPSNVIYNVGGTGQCKETAADALFLYCCNTGRIDDAHHLTEIIHIYVSEKLNVEDFVNLYGKLNRNMIDKYLKVLKYMFMDENHILELDDLRGKLLSEIISNKQSLLEILLERFKDLKFNEPTLQFCGEILRHKNLYRREYLSALRRLQIISSERDILYRENLTVEEENKELKYLQSQTFAACKAFLIRRINYHIKTKDLNRISELLSIYDELNVPYSPLLLSKLTALYCLAADVEKATILYNKLKDEFPSFKLDLVRALDYVTLLTKYLKLDESIEVMKNITEPYVYVNKENVMKKIATLSLAVSNSNNAEFAKTMQNLMLPLCAEFKTNKALLNSVLQLHLRRNEFNAAFEEFKNSIKNHRNPVGLNIFLKKCISVGEKDILQKVIDLTVSCVSKSYAVLELSIAFIENRNYEKASAVVQNLGKGANPKDVEDLCGRLINQNKLTELEHFLSITSPLNLSNREALYRFAINAYANKSNYDKVAELYNKLKQEIGEPSRKTVDFIQELFASHNQPIPLTIVSNGFSEGSPSPHEATKDFIAYLEAGNAEAALKELGELKKGYIRTLSLKTLTDLVDLCLQQNCVNDLSCNVQTMSYIIDNPKEVLRPVLEKYSAAGDVEKFINIARFFPDFSLMNIGFNTYFCQAYISSGKQDDLLLQLEQRVDIKNKMFSYAAFEELAKCPEFESRVFDLAVKYYDSKFFLPMSVLWALHFSKENFDMANKIFKNFTITIDKADNIILRVIKKNENVTLAREYINAVKSLNVRNRIKERAYGTALDVLVLKGMHDDAVALVLETEKLGLQLSKYYLSTLVTLKNVLEKENKPVPFHLPSDALSQSSSDDSE